MTAKAPDDPFAACAPFYDLDLEGYDDDVLMYRELAARVGGEVLELGCGTGRVAAALAAEGAQVVGIDSSPAMLEVARKRSGGLPLTLLQADMREVRLHRRFNLVLIPLGGLQHMETALDVAATMQTVARHLARGGLAVVDIETIQPEDFEPGPRPLIEHWTRPFEGGAVTKLVSVEGRPVDGMRIVTYHFDAHGPDGTLRRTTQRFSLRAITQGELELAGRLAGLEVSAWYGDYELSRLRDGDERLVAMFEHAA